jgi:flagellar protein FliS
VNPAADRYLADRVATASPAELTAMLFDAAVAAAKAAERAQADGDWTTATQRLIKAQRIVLELRVSLNGDAGQVATNLYHLYTYCHEQWVQASMQRDAQSIKNGLDVLAPLAEAWRQACCTSKVA